MSAAGGVVGVAMAETRPANRAADIATIHVLQKQLGITKDDAEALKRQLTGKASSADMSDAQRRRVIGHLRKLESHQKAIGAALRVPAGNRQPADRAVDDPSKTRWEKARVLWSLLARAGEVKNDTDAALQAYAKRQTGVEQWRWLNGYQINTVIESLKRWCRRAGVEFENG